MYLCGAEARTEERSTCYLAGHCHHCINRASSQSIEYSGGVAEALSCIQAGAGRGKSR